MVWKSTQDNAKYLEQLKFGFKRTINCDKYQLKTTIQIQNPYLYFLIDPSFQGESTIFVLSLENDNDKKGHKKYFLPKVEMKDYNVVIDGQNVFDQLVKNVMRIFDKIRNIASGQRGDYTTDCSLDCLYLKEYYEMIAIDLSKQQALDTGPKKIQQIN